MRNEIILSFVQHFLNFILMYVIIRVLVYNPVKKFMTERSKKIELEQKKANAMHIKAEKTQEKYEQKIMQAHEEAKIIIARGENRAKLAAERNISMARERADKLRSCIQ